MKPIKMFLVLLCLLLFRNGYTQLFHPFEGIGEVILFADTLKACDQADAYIDQIKDEISHGKTGEPDKAWYNLAVCYAAKRQADSACQCLLECIGQSASYHNLVLTDIDFGFLHQIPCWEKITVRLKGMQIFGTQVYQRKDPETGEPGKYRYFPIKDERHVDSLRKEMGLIPLKDYYAVFGIDYEPPTE